MKSSEILYLDRKYIQRKPFVPFIIEKAKGSIIYDKNNKKYIDFMAGLYGTVAIGWQRKEVISAMKIQLDKLTFAPEKSPSEVCSKLAEKINKLTPTNISKCLRAVSGSEETGDI